MSFDPNWRERAGPALRAYFARKSSPRAALSVVLLATGAIGFLASYAMLRAGVSRMSVRYPIAVLVGYAALLGLIRAWVELEHARFNPADAEIVHSPSPVRDDRRESGRWWKWLDPSVAHVLEFEGCLVIAVLAVILMLIGAVIMTIAAAPGLIVEVFIDVFIVSVVYRRLRIAQREHWLGAAMRKTWLPALVTAAALAAAGWTLERVAPGAPSIGKAIKQLRDSS